MAANLTLAIAFLTGLGVVVAGMLDSADRPAGVTVALTAVAVILAVPLMVWFARDLVHVLLNAVLPAPRPLPEAELDDELLARLATCVVYPVIIHAKDDVDALLATMIATRDEGGAGPLAHVALVDFGDSPTPQGENDTELRREIEARLRAADARAGQPPLAALFRARRWNPAEQTWMGWERKRGKLVEFVDVVTDGLAAETSFVVDTPGERALVQRLHGIRYLLTIDVGTRLNPGGVRRMIATAVHPDNTAVIDERDEVVVSGYGVIRPHQALAITGTFFSWTMYSGPPAKPAPSIGQQMIGHDVFFGQGMMDVAAFRAILRHRVPDNTVLSHDKLEGAHVGAACQTEVALLDQTPSDYLTFRQRYHRWIRGDLHLVRWIFGRGGGSGTSEPRSLGLIGRWQLAEDLAGHSHSVSVLSLLVFGWLVVPTGDVGAWTLVILALLVESIVTEPLNFLVRHRLPDPDNASRWVLVTRALTAELIRWAFWTVLLADRALFTIDAEVRALYRTLISHRHVLQWVSYAHLSRGADSRDARAWWQKMWQSPALGLVLTGVVSVVSPAALPWAAPLLALWLVAPAVAMWASRPRSWLPTS